MNNTLNAKMDAMIAQQLTNKGRETGVNNTWAVIGAVITLLMGGALVVLGYLALKPH